VDRMKATASGRECRGNRIEWTGAGGDYFLAVVVDQDDEVIAEHWATRKEVLAWMETRWLQIPSKFVPMAYGPARRHLKRSNEGPVRNMREHRI
jgi:hypothetical protein